MKKKILILLTISFLLNVNQTKAQDKKETSGNYNLGEIIVTATKTEQYQANVGSSSTVITAEAIEQSGKTNVLDILRDTAGVSIIQSGGYGGATEVFLRGAKSGHTLVLIDGVEVNDPMKSDRSFDFAHLTTDNIARIEIIRGPQSTLYGSDAMAGVINIITKKGEGPLQWQASFEGGSHNTFKESLGFSGAGEKLDYAFSMAHFDSDGISKAVDGAEKDGYDNITFSNRLGYDITETANLDFSLRFTNAKYDYDDGAYQDDPNKTGWWRHFMSKTEFKQAINTIWNHKLSLSYSKTRRELKNEADVIDPTDDTHNWFRGNLTKIEWQNNIYPTNWMTSTCGFEYEEERGYGDGRVASKPSRFDRKAITTKGYYIQNQFNLLDNLSIIGGLRGDYHELFGSETTYKISTSYIVSKTSTRLKANWGTGFKSPSIYQLYSSNYGNINLAPEENMSFDFGLGQYFYNDKISVDLNYFYSDFKNMIEWNTRYKNIDNAQIKGVEMESSFKISPQLSLSGNYTYTQTKDNESAMKIRRRPKNQMSLGLNWTFLEKGNINLTTSYIGHSWDDTANTVKIKPYAKIDLYTSYNLTDTFQIFGKIDNLFNKTYQQVRGYANSGISFYAGGKIKFN
ncbi:MAG: TonB-dependent receptor [Candidatus Omnitrophica bacterium]|nr:TonB-dependent receptor [Candidatus Omnitrophota bacterium]